MTTHECQSATEMAAVIAAGLASLPMPNTPRLRAVRRSYSRALRDCRGDYVLAVARALRRDLRWRWIALELIADHREAFALLDSGQIEDLGRGMADWGAVDTFGRTIAGPAWLHGLLGDDDIARWAASEDRWWRRAALVCTVALNTPSQGGAGDAARTLAVCRLLVGDRDDMVVKALSWALRKLSERDPDAVRAFVRAHEDDLAARVKREVAHKLETGLKNPRRRG